MRSFEHINARTVDEACALLGKYNGKAMLNAGGTDLLSTLKGEHLLDYPEAVINIKTISGLDYIKEDEGALKIGTLAKLSDVARSSLLRERYGALAEAARSVATPQVRNVATIGGNLCQDVRCWYYRYPRHIGGPISCLRKGNGPCMAVSGDNRYHAIMGGKRCFAVCPSDTAIVLAAMDARIKVAGPDGKRGIAVTDFLAPLGNALKRDEILTEIEVPRLNGSTKQTFLKFTLRKPVDFAIVSVASVITLHGGVCTDARIALGAVAPGPVRAKKAEESIEGRPIDQAAAAAAAELAVAGAKPLSMNAYKIEITKALVTRALLT
ncbi:MAG TPA: xanthine dehydrogenase family protein subunit M [Desulfatiglandales bacterium]|nr:xanthine dehydrogenase family protein subunit M [Desulfatiglandales bacterium]